MGLFKVEAGSVKEGTLRYHSLPKCTIQRALLTWQDITKSKPANDQAIKHV